MEVQVSWYDRAVSAIHEATRLLPDGIPLGKRVKIVDAAYPFGSRDHFPYKMWLKARYAYLQGFGYQKRGGEAQMRLPLSPLERARERSEARPS